LPLPGDDVAMRTAPKPNLVARYFRLFVGLWLFALGVVMTLRAELGVAPWDVLHDGLRLRTPLTFGMAVIVIGIVLVGIAFAAGVRPGPGTIANMLLIGVFEDLMLASEIGTGLEGTPFALRLAILLGGVLAIGLGSALYIGARLGAGPRDSMMVLVATRFGVRVGIARAIVEGSALIAGFALGGSAGLGTAIFALTIGPSVDVSFRLFKMDAEGQRKETPPVGSAQ
jgi:uncharacterized membrane protein YczE